MHDTTGAALSDIYNGKIQCGKCSFPGTSVELCDLFGSLCFRERMSDASAAFSSLEEERFCPPDCDAVSFTFSESSTDIRWDKTSKTQSNLIIFEIIYKIVR